jgi:glycosyltransferase involved in cell wall biosynthesis
MIGTAVIDAQSEFEGFDFTGADCWHVLVLNGRMPAARVDLPSPGAVTGNALAEAALLRRADAERARGELIHRLCRRLGEGVTREVERPRISVVVCTHRRSHYLPDLLESVCRLDPAPCEVIVVDNDPGLEDCQELVQRLGLRYLREDRRGLDNARNAGLRAARGEVVAFTDDDCVLSPGWLATLHVAFEHEGVAAVTGPVFPYLLDTPARVRMEHQASLARGLRRVVFDWQVISPLHAAAMGVGANMAIRRACLLDLGEEPFPPELDAGTETESGGDTYLLSRLLAAGKRVIYEPEMFVFHQHRSDGSALSKAVLGYGVGLSASLTKLVLEERELSAPRAWAWLVKQYLQTQRRRAVGRADAIETRLSWDYLRGGFLGAGRWRRALLTQRSAAVASGSRERPLAKTVATLESAYAPIVPVAPIAGASPPINDLAVSDPAAPAVSVIVPTFRREQALRRCLQALAEQDLPPGSFEVIVVDDDSRGGGSDDGGGDDGGGDNEDDGGGNRDLATGTQASVSYPFVLRRLPGTGRGGAAAARNQGARSAAAQLLLFLDDDVVADRWLVRRHLQWHAERDEDGALVGPYRPRPARLSFAASVAQLWWQDVFHLLEDALAMTFVAALTANLSLPRAVFEEVGGFSEDYSRQRREDWEWGLRMRRAGVSIAFDREASARHEFTLATEQRLRDARREGVGDTLIAAGYPEALASLPLLSLRLPTPRAPLRWIGFSLWRRAFVSRMVLWMLDLLELCKLREPWMWLFRLAQSASYAHGAYEGGWRSGSSGAYPSTPALELELLSEERVSPPEVAAPNVRVTLQGVEVARVFPREGVWGTPLAEQIVDAMEPESVARAVAWGGWLSDYPEFHKHCDQVEVIFGPANPASDLLHREGLERLGARVRVVQGDPARHWEALVTAARAGERPLVAFALPGTAPGPAWLLEALSAFDGERVGLVFGGALPPDDPPEPLYLHDRRSSDISLTMVGHAPAYMVIRRALVVDLPADLPRSGELVGPVMAMVKRALECGWVIGHRDVRGLRAPAYPARERGDAYGRLEARALAGLHGTELMWASVGSLMRGVLTLGWLALKQRGRLSDEQRELAAGVTRGAARALLVADKDARK